MNLGKFVCEQNGDDNHTLRLEVTFRCQQWQKTRQDIEFFWFCSGFQIFDLTELAKYAELNMANEYTTRLFKMPIFAHLLRSIWLFKSPQVLEMGKNNFFFRNGKFHLLFAIPFFKQKNNNNHIFAAVVFAQ